jgi:putative endonuclease
MAWVYILRGASGRHYIGSTENLDRRLREHKRGSNHTTRRFRTVVLVASRQMPSMTEARSLEIDLKKKKNPQLAIFALNSREQPRKLSGLVPGSSPGRPISFL